MILTFFMLMILWITYIYLEDYRRPFKTRVRPQKPSCFTRKSQIAEAFSTAGSKSGHRFLVSITSVFCLGQVLGNEGCWKSWFLSYAFRTIFMFWSLCSRGLWKIGSGQWHCFWLGYSLWRSGLMMDLDKMALFLFWNEHLAIVDWKVS